MTVEGGQGGGGGGGMSPSQDDDDVIIATSNIRVHLHAYLSYISYIYMNRYICVRPSPLTLVWRVSWMS